MKRKLNKGIFFYPMEADHTSNKRIRLLFNDHDSDGYWIWSNLISYAYKQHGYYFMANTEDIELLAADCRKSPELIQSVIDSCVKRGLFVKEIYERYKVLTNDRMQINYLRATFENRRKGSVIYFDEKYYAINAEDLKELSEKSLINALFKKSGKELKLSLLENGYSLENDDISMEKSQNSLENDDISMEKGQNSLHKGKERKGKEIYLPDGSEKSHEENGVVGIKKTDVLIGVKSTRRRQKKESDPEKLLFNNIKNYWMVWFAGRNKGRAANFSGKEASAVSKLRSYFIQVAKHGGGNDIYREALSEFTFILDNWELLKGNNFLYSAVDICMISSKINDITNFINNGQQKSAASSVGRTIKLDRP